MIFGCMVLVPIVLPVPIGAVTFENDVVAVVSGIVVGIMAGEPVGPGIIVKLHA